jgi:hypothetical protein
MATQPPKLSKLKRERTFTIMKLAAKAWRLRQQNKNQAMYSLICDEFLALGGIYIKFLQGVLLHSHVMKQWQSQQRYSVFEELKYENINLAEILKSQLNPAKAQQLASFETQPFAAGSFGQVYIGYLVDGQKVAIKVMRPGIQQTLRYDVKLLSLFAKRLGGDFSVFDVDLRQATDDFVSSTLRETDYEYEANFAAELHQTYRDHSYLVIPKTYLDLCTQQIIVQEFIDGVSLAHLLKQQESGVDIAAEVKRLTGSDLNAQLNMLGYEFIVGAFCLPRIMGDPHPGNVRLMSGNRVGLVDFGIASHGLKNPQAAFGLIEQYAKNSCGQSNAGAMFISYIRFFANDLYEALITVGRVLSQRRGKVVDIKQDLEKIVLELVEKELAPEELASAQGSAMLGAVVNKVANKNNRFSIVAKVNELEFLRAIQTLLTLFEAVGQRGLIAGILNNAYSTLRDAQPRLAESSAQPMSIDTAMGVVTAWLERIAERDPRFYVQIKQKLQLA